MAKNKTRLFMPCFRSGQRDSNPRHSAWEARTLWLVSFVSFISSVFYKSATVGIHEIAIGHSVGGNITAQLFHLAKYFTA